MQKIFSAQQVKQLDEATISEQHIRSDQLMERAAHQFVDSLSTTFLANKPILIVAGSGNNGGDALAIARILLDKGIKSTVYFFRISRISSDCQLNLDRLKQYGEANITEYAANMELPSFGGYVIDGLFGSGLNRPVEGFWKELIVKINKEAISVVSIDIPSGFFADELTKTTHVKSANVITFDAPKLSFLLPESQAAIRSFRIVDIGLDQVSKDQLETPNYYITSRAIRAILKRRNKFSHKGMYGKVCIVGGTEEMIGGVTLAGKAALSSGCGYVYYQVPMNKWESVLKVHPEGIIERDTVLLSSSKLDKVNIKEQYTFGIGPAMGVHKKAQKSVIKLLSNYQKPLVLDADGLNIVAALGLEKQRIPQHSILTPHQKEFTRLFGDNDNSYDQLNTLIKAAVTFQLYICLKGPHTIIACPDGSTYFNSTGNPGMAVAGSGDVLTGMITSFLAQGYSPKEAAILGVFLHGHAGDLCAEAIGVYGVTASRLIDYIPISLLSVDSVSARG